MHLIIEHRTTKREISGSFNILGTKEDLLSLVDQIKNTIPTDEKPFYGWIRITESPQPSIPNTAPKGWD